MVLNWVRKRIAIWAIRYICETEGHAWKQVGGRSCPYYGPTADCSQPVFQCTRCLDHDYGQEGGKGWESCAKCDLRTVTAYTTKRA